jgi:hypothetical protein
MREEPSAPVEAPQGAAERADSPDATARRRQPTWLVAIVAVAVVALVAGVFCIAGLLLGRSRSSAPATITVTGSGTVQGTPDTANFQIGVQTVARTATEALAQNDVRVARLETAMEQHGVTAKEMQTSGLDIYQNTDAAGNATGFTVDDNVTVTMHSMRSVGGALDAATNAAGNGIQLSGITFSISNDSNLLASARARAIRNAHAAAAQITKGAGTGVGGVVRITDQENAATTSIIVPALAAESNASNVPVEAGSQPVSVQVTVVYSLGS